MNNKRKVTDIIGETYNFWEVNDEIILDFQTGTGKTYFILNVLHKYAEENGDAILYLFNRKAVGKQQKLEMLRKVKADKIIESEEVENIEWIGNVRFVSYQKLEYWYKVAEYPDRKDLWRKYRYVILDEAHFFLADCGFNKEIMGLLEQIKPTPGTIRIWISATFDETWKFMKKHLQICTSMDTDYIENMRLREIFTDEKMPIGLENQELQISKFYTESICFGLKKHNVWYYKNTRDYSYVNEIICFSKIEECVNLIERIKVGEKALVFVSAKKVGEVLKRKVKGKSLYFINADEVQQNPKNMSEILSEESFTQDVLVSTKIIDNGVNFQDESLCHVFMLGITDKTDFMQMLGRKRKGKTKITLYVQDVSLDDLKKRLGNEMEKLEVSNLNEEEAIEKLWNPRWAHIVNFVWIFDKKKRTGIVNKPLVEKTKMQIEFLKDCIQKIESYEITSFSQVVAGWMGKELDGDCIPVKTDKEVFEDFLEGYVGKELDKEEQRLFRSAFKELLPREIAKKGGCRYDRGWGLSVAKKCLEIGGFGFDIETSVVNGVTVWKVVKFG